MKRKSTITILCVAFLLSSSLFYAFGDSKEEAQFKSKKPLYAKVALTEDGSKVLLVVFDKSDRFAKGYDVIYADTNLNGKLEQAEKVKAKTRKRSKMVYCSFPPIKLDVPYNEKAKGISRPCEVTLSYHKHPNKKECFSVTTNIKLQENSTQWRYSFSGDIKPSKSLENAPVWSFNRTPEIKITTRPDGQKKGNLGIGLDLKAGDIDFECKKGGAPAKARIVIKDPDGKVVKKGSAKLDKFVFG